MISLEGWIPFFLKVFTAEPLRNWVSDKFSGFSSDRWMLLSQTRDDQYIRLSGVVKRPKAGFAYWVISDSGLLFWIQGPIDEIHSNGHWTVPVHFGDQLGVSITVRIIRVSIPISESFKEYMDWTHNRNKKASPAPLVIDRQRVVEKLRATLFVDRNGSVTISAS